MVMMIVAVSVAMAVAMRSIASNILGMVMTVTVVVGRGVHVAMIVSVGTRLDGL